MAEKDEKKKLFSVSGRPIAENQDVKTAGKRGPMLLEDFWFLEKLAHFDREVIPERRMHAKGSGAFGTFKVTHDISQFTKANIFSEIGKETDVFVRFSTVAGERGAADAERDIRGFAIKFYTAEGNWDLTGNNTPVFFLRDPYRFPDLNKAVKRDPKTNLRNANHNWDFWTLLPEALHQVTITMSERGIPKSYRNMNGYGSHTFSMINADNKRVWVKFHFKTEQGIENLSNEEARNIIAGDRESHQRDLINAIADGNYPRWKMKIQVMTEEQAKECPFNPFDLTKVWPHGDYPLHEVGVLELNRNPENYYADVEQAAFNPANVVPGVGFSPDRMLQARLFSYGDAQRYRLGVNHYQIPVNKPKCPFHNPSRDGRMRVDGNEGSTLHYFPNSYQQWEEQREFTEPPLPLEGNADHYDFREDDDDYYTQPGNLFRIMDAKQKNLLFKNTAAEVGNAEKFIQERHIRNCYKADPDYGKGVAEALDIDIEAINLN